MGGSEISQNSSEISLNCVPKMNEGLMGMEQHGINFHFWVNYPFKGLKFDFKNPTDTSYIMVLINPF